MKVVLVADKVVVSGPKVDGGYKVTFEIGEYEQAKVAQVMTIPQQTPIVITVQTEDERERSARIDTRTEAL